MNLQFSVSPWQSNNRPTVTSNESRLRCICFPFKSRFERQSDTVQYAKKAGILHQFNPLEHWINPHFLLTLRSRTKLQDLRLHVP